LTIFNLFKTIKLNLTILLPLTNPLTTITLFLNLTNNINNTKHNKQTLITSIYIFTILIIS
ncbi:stress protection protein MarC, partial [Bacillus thuringiensis]|nr:stress protection protein MarC [Bacillus thuringiensis]